MGRSGSACRAAAPCPMTPTDTVQPAVSVLELRAGELRAALRPDLGASVAGLWLGELPVLRSTEPSVLDTARLSGCFPLAPYSNRLGFRRFRWHGVEHTTAANVDGPHSLHGVAWQRAWRVDASGADSAELSYRHAPDEHWPFAFELRQQFGLSPDALSLRMVFTSTDARPQPAGLGWHPYFPKRLRSRLHIECSDRWERDAGTLLPTRRVAQAGLDGEVRHLDFDHVFEGWKGAARIRDEKLSLRLSSSLDRLVVYTPPARDYFCIEPVSHVNDAVHLSDPTSHGLVDLAPGQAIEASMRLEVARA